MASQLEVDCILVGYHDVEFSRLSPSSLAYETPPRVVKRSSTGIPVLPVEPISMAPHFFHHFHVLECDDQRVAGGAHGGQRLVAETLGGAARLFRGAARGLGRLSLEFGLASG